MLERSAHAQQVIRASLSEPTLTKCLTRVCFIIIIIIIILDECRTSWGEPEVTESIAQQQSCNVVAKGYYVWVFLASYGVY